jgi:PAS domain S-box-containing protein
MKSKMKKKRREEGRRNVSPKHIAAVTALLALLLFVAAFFGMRYISGSVLRVMEADGAALIESLILSSQNSLKAEGAVLGMLADRLFDDCRSVEGIQNPTTASLLEVAVARGLAYVGIYDRSGRLLASSAEHMAPFGVDSTLVPRGEEVFLGHKEGEYGCAIARRENGEIILCAIDASYIEYLKKDISIGSLLDSLRETQGVVYLLLQDPEEGIIFASKNIDKMKKIKKDPFLNEAVASNSARSRLYDFQGTRVLEVVKPFFLNEEPYGIYRAGLSLEGYNEVMRGSRRQIIAVTGVLFLVGIVILTLLTVNQTLEVTSRSYSQIRTFTDAVLESMGTGVMAIDREGVVTVLNSAAQSILGLSPSVLGKPYAEVLPRDTVRLKEVLGGRTSKTEFEAKIDDSVVLVARYPLLDAQGEVTGGTALLKDITEMRRMEKEMKQRERLSLLGDTAASVAHEVRNPLNAISMAAQRLEAEYGDRQGMEDARKFSRILRDEVKRLDNIVGQFLSLARPSKLQMGKTDLNRLVEETVTLVREEAGSLSVRIRTSLGEIPLLMLDAGEIKKAVINILRNGMEAAGKGGTVSVRTRMADGMVALDIEDSGAGMSKEEMARAFQPYFTTKRGGTGLGLSIAQRVVADHGGRIDVDSVPGQRTVFTIWLSPPDGDS